MASQPQGLPEKKMSRKTTGAGAAGASAGVAAHQAGLPLWAIVAVVLLAAIAGYVAVHLFMQRKD